MDGTVSRGIIEKWLKAWSLSRKLPLPEKYKSGFKIEVGEEKQKARYVFPEITEDFIQLSKEINDSWVYLKVAASADEVKESISRKWQIQPPGYMMYCTGEMISNEKKIPEEYNMTLEKYNASSTLKIFAENGTLACSGHLVLVDDLAIYDRIATEEEHRRKGLASFLMHELEKIVLLNGISNSFLVATAQGKTLYESLGWKLYSPYTSVVIPGT
ncbi:MULTISPECIES: GNAT family N-acetyltransferase [Chryseobacterium]|uniref:GNAT family N-acetyltransferase n=1 Tax=Chryseobacterium TaxID=59732 RepID=UPI0012971619|nr:MULTISPECIES: GNAT family N-acetyltransferase [Chryseobacterium]MDR6923583.1 hypothetical protein [Chryseobacterium sp. 2987]